MTESRYAIGDCMLSCNLIDTKARRHEVSQRGKAATKKTEPQISQIFTECFLGVQFDQHTTLSDGV
jgi:hypothetical protein